jgi:outer membrane protein assembly factor BamB
LALAACSGARMQVRLFSTEWEDDGGASIARVWDRIGGAAVPAAPNVVVGVADDGGPLALVGMALDGTDTAPWRFEHPLDARPAVVGGVVVGSGGGETFALDALHGQLLWRRPTPGLAFLGAGDDGATTVASFRRSGSLGSVLVAMHHDGTLVREIDSERPLGSPAVVSNLAFVPWAGEYVSVIDLATGDETARVTLRTETSHAFAQGGSLWFGEMAFARFDAHIREASKGQATLVTLPSRDLPGTPRLMRSGGAVVPPMAGAEDKVHLYARPAAGADDAHAIPSDGRFYATCFRLVMGFDATNGKLGWVRLRGADVLAGAAGSGGVVFCDAKGDVVALDAATGGILSEAHLGHPLRGCVVRVDEGRLTGSPADTQPLVTALEQAVRADDPMLASGQRFLLRELATVDDASATQTLVDLASDPRTGPDLLLDARAALAKRRTGAAAMEAALERHYDYLKDILRPPPVGPIARALGAMKERAAAPLLAAHLLDPEDTSDDTKEAAAALATLAGPGELPAMRRFFGMYRATADDDNVAAAVVSVGEALLSMGDKDGRAQVELAVSDAMTVPYARERLEAMLAGQAAGNADGGAQSQSLPAPAQSQSPTAPPQSQSRPAPPQGQSRPAPAGPADPVR